MITKICTICGKEFQVIPYRNNTAKYCSKKCADKSHEGSLNCTCEFCGKKFHRKQSHINKTKYKGDAPKFEVLLETLETLQAENHKALIFSQFVETLKLVRKELDARKIKYMYLDGQTQKRQAKVDEFQNDPSIPFFLISLKAGGVGLNLTAADYVIHLDPWWNPAVEMQASDRVHRIGQPKPVFIYKIIARDTVEEKILQLQEKKRALVKNLIATESSFFKSLTGDDVKILFE